MSTQQQAKLFKVVCSDWNGAVRGRPYRKLAVDPKSSLAMLAEDILGAFDFDMDHMYGFYNNLKDWTRATEGYELLADLGEGDRFPGTTHTPISKAFQTPRQKMLMLFDYGDEWRFIVEFLGEQDVPAKAEFPLILESVGEAPEQYPDWEEDDDEEHDEEVGDEWSLLDPESQSPIDPKIEERIQEDILVDTFGSEERAMSWYSYLQEELPAPFNATCARRDLQSPLLEGDKVRVIGLADSSVCQERIRVMIEWEKRQFAVPLEQLEPVRMSKTGRQALYDWVYWCEQGYSF